MKTTSVLAGLLAAAITTPALAQGGPPPFTPEKDPAKIQGGAYVVEPGHTRVMFGISHKGFTTFYGEFPEVTGELNLNPASPAASNFDLKVKTASISTQNKTLDEELRHKPWLDADSYPEMRFKSTSVKRTGANTADVTGDFTFHGQTHPLTLHVKFNAAGADPQDKFYVAGFDVTGSFKRSDWGFKTAVPLIGDDINLQIAAAFKKP